MPRESDEEGGVGIIFVDGIAKNRTVSSQSPLPRRFSVFQKISFANVRVGLIAEEKLA